ncbi:M42 family metallopeptidase [Prevotella communis]|uniref:M42 family metallopeptidase n=1 Tax=Prevotella communis TaxID=2913614 RepID=UPI001EDB7E4A|nr:M42 family metallopeptidase [Prevotella communis]UKK67543.1 M42 family metallopeptidase [Prevotella communis]UKK70310.1 M42 family metallopeptidase [Prevotella communis]
MDEFLKNILTIPAPSGYEEEFQNIFKEHIKKYVDRVETDNMGNIIAVREGPMGSPKIMLSAHCDEVGFLISNIDENGFLYVQEIGGIDTDLLPGRKVDIHTEKGKIAGIIGKKAIHLTRGEEKKKLEVSDIWIDIAANSKENAEKRVQIGDFVTYAKDVVFYENGFLASPSTDDRIGVWTLLETAKMLAEQLLNCSVYFVSSCQEELGARGAKTAADYIHPDVGIAIDVTHATDYPTADTKVTGRINLGNGPVITMGPNINSWVCHQLKALAKDIPVQYEVIARPTGTDANVMQLSSGGIKTALVSIPCRYMHTPYEMVSVDDARQTAQLLGQFVLHNF